MPGPILNPQCEIIPLPFRIDSREYREFTATPETLPVEIGKRVLSSESWNLWTGFRDRDVMGFFDAPRVVHYDPGNREPWRAVRSDALLMTFSRACTSWKVGRTWLGESIYLGPGWEGYAADIYWGVARGMQYLIAEMDKDGEKDQMVQMALEGMMRSHGRL